MANELATYINAQPIVDQPFLWGAMEALYAAGEVHSEAQVVAHWLDDAKFTAIRDKIKSTTIAATTALIDQRLQHHGLI